MKMKQNMPFILKKVFIFFGVISGKCLNLQRFCNFKLRENVL